MDNKTKPFLTIAVIFLAVIFLSLLFYYFRFKPNTNSQQTPSNSSNSQNGQTQTGQLNYREPQTKIEIGTQGLTRGIFAKVEGNEIYLQTNDTLTKLPLTLDEVVVSCTKQDLSTAKELDFNQVVKVEATTPNELGSKIPVNEPVVLFAQLNGGVNRVHTVAVAESKCAF